MSETMTPTFEAHLPPPEWGKGQREHQAFLRLLPQLLDAHQGQYVAVHEGQVIDSDTDDIALIQRVHARIGYVPIHVGLVTEQPLVVRVPHYREYRPRGGHRHATRHRRRGDNPPRPDRRRHRGHVGEAAVSEPARRNRVSLQCSHDAAVRPTLAERIV